MRPWFDHFAKGILSALLRPVAHVETEREIVGHAQTADIWVDPSPVSSEEQSQLGVVGRMIAMGPCLIEPFSQTPRPRDVRACVCKQYNLDHVRTRDAIRDKVPAPPFPRLWIISPGQPKTVLEQIGCRAMDNWPAGFREGRAWDALNIVEINALPRTPDTLPLRLLGRGKTLIEAIRDLGDLPEPAWPKRLLVPVLVAFRADISQDPEEKKVMQIIQEIDAIYERWEKRVKDEGRAEGRAEGREEGRARGREEGRARGREEGRAEGLAEGRRAQRVVLLRLLDQRFGPLPGHVQQRIQEADSEHLQRWTERVISARVLADVFE